VEKKKCLQKIKTKRGGDHCPFFYGDFAKNKRDCGLADRQQNEQKKDLEKAWYYGVTYNKLRICEACSKIYI
jgi:hypothetical protein